MSKQLADLLLKERLISQADYSAAEENYGKTKELHVKFLTRAGIITEDKLVAFFSKKYSIPSFDLSKYAVAEEVIKTLSTEEARRYKMIPLQKAKGTVVVAICDPTALVNLEDMKFRTQMKVEAVITSISAFEAAMEKYYGVLTSLESQVRNKGEADAVEDVGMTADAHEIKDAGEIDAPIIQLVNSILVDAIKKKASDIHIEPYEHSFRVRYRIDGALYESMKPPAQVKNAVIARVKIMARMDIAEKRLPQDGRIK
ncbi:MAG: Flp pilus assembly complex ATPase component TadA, partial [Bdellovibrionales bacterium]|nr:Flp pilus assembly complex ATPase component TadA [Bdellovibrionales bacterium]